MIQVSMTDKAGVTLATAGKYCADNVQVTPSEEILRKEEQEKSATPSETAQEVVPDDGKVLSKVSVGAITPAIVGGLNAKTYAAGAVSAIEGKGVTVPASTKMDGMAALIASIPTGSGGATEPYVEETMDSEGYELYAVTLHGHTAMRPFMFMDESYLSEIILPATLVNINESACQMCPSLTHIDFPAALEYIGMNAFRDSGLTSIDLPASILAVEAMAFAYCTSLTTATIRGIYDWHELNSSGTLPFADDMFEGCDNLTEINLSRSYSEDIGLSGAPWGAINATINYN